MRKIFNIKKYFSIILLVLCSFFVVSDCFAWDGNMAINFNPLAKNDEDKVQTNLYAHDAGGIGGKSIYDKDENKCLPATKYKPRKEGVCLFCSVVATVFNTVSTIANNAIVGYADSVAKGNNAIVGYADSVAKVVIIGFAVWLAIQIISFVSSIETRDIKDLLQSIFTQGFLVLISVMIIKTGIANFLNAFVVPIYSTGHQISQKIFEESNDKTRVNQIRGAARTFILDNKKLPNGLPQDMGVTILQTMTQMEDGVRKFQALGSSLMCQSWKDGWWILPSIRLLLLGLSLWVSAMVLIIAIPFLLVDSVFQLGVATVLMPIAVGSFAFKSTRQYSKKVWETFLNSMFAFLFISIIVFILLVVLQQIAESGLSFNSPAIKEVGATFDDMFMQGKKGMVYFSALKDGFSWDSITFLELIFTFVLAWSVMNMGKDFAKEFADSISSTSIGSNIATMGASTIKSTSLGIITPLKDSAVRSFQNGVSRATRGIFHAGRQMKINRQVKKFDKNNATEVNGVKTYTDTKGRVHTLENGVITTVKKGKNGQETITIQSKDITVTRTKDKNGNYKERIKLNNDKLNQIIRPDGSVDTATFASMFQNISNKEHADILKAAMVKRIAEKRIPNGYNREQKLSKQTEIIKSENGEIILKDITKDGDVIFTKVRLDDNGVLETSITEVSNRGGKVKTMTSDGYRNILTTGELNQDVKQSDLTSINAVNSHMNDKKTHTSYGLSKFYREKVDKGWLRVTDVNGGMLDGDKLNYANDSIARQTLSEKANINAIFK